MKKFGVCLLAAVMVLGVLAGCGKKEEKNFTVGFDAEFPPYGYMDDNGEYTGFDLELAEEVCKRNGWTLVKQPIVLGCNRLYLEWLYHEWKRGSVYLVLPLCG